MSFLISLLSSRLWLYYRPIAFLLISYSIFPQTPTIYVDPFIGTHDSRPMQFPGPVLPFGMVKLSPDNQESGWKASHDYAIKNIAGFNFLHDYHNQGFYVLPVTGDIQTQPGPEDNPDLGYRSRISNDNEFATPGYYSVVLDDYNIKAELSTTTRVGIQRYTFPKSENSAIFFDLEIPYEDPGDVLEAKVSKVNDKEIEGYIKVLDEQKNGVTIWLQNDYYLYFVCRFDKPFKSLGGWIDGKITENIQELSGKGDVGCFVKYNTVAGEQINVHTALSMVSPEQARLNLDTETKDFGFDFEKYTKNAKKIWDDLLCKIQIKDDNLQNKIKFYTNLYRVYSARTIWSDVNGKWVDMNEDIVQSDGPVYGSDAFWGMQWNLNGLWSLINPSIMNSWVKSLLEIYKRGGWLPKGPTAGEYTAIMTSSPAVSLIVAAYQQGIRDYDVQLAYKAISEIMKIQGKIHESGGYVGNRWLQQYMDYGYVSKEDGPASVTMEMAYQDWCVAQMAKDLGKMDDYEFFLKRSENYKNLLDANVGYVRERSSAGNWISPFNPFSSRGFIEGNPWQYTFYAPHDVQSIINFLGRDVFIDRLEKGFENSRKSRFNATGDKYADFPINHGNQPNMQAAFLFNYAGQPWQTQQWVREILNIYYGNKPENGWPGDEDQGQMGAWFTMSSLGLFQMQGGCSTEPTFDLTSPLFKKAIVTLENGKTLKILAPKNSDKNVYIQSVKLNGKPLNRCWVYYSELKDGATLEYDLGPEPNKSWGISQLPPSESKPKEWVDDNENQLLIEAQKLEDEINKTFFDSVTVSMKQGHKGGIIKYTTDGTNPTVNSFTYNGPLQFMETVKLSAQVFDAVGKPIGSLRRTEFEKIDHEINIATGQKTSASIIEPNHHPDLAVDGIVDRINYWDAAPYPQWWMIELDKPQTVSKLKLHTYWDNYRYYQYNIEASMDGEKWHTIVDASKNTQIATNRGYAHSISPIKAKFFKINMLYNSANVGVHISEFRIYP